MGEALGLDHKVWARKRGGGARSPFLGSHTSPLPWDADSAQRSAAARVHAPLCWPAGCQA